MIPVVQNVERTCLFLNSKKENYTNPLWDYDLSLQGEEYDYVCGIDEAGRGSIAGSIVAAAIILKPEASTLKINDSKKLSEKSREKLYDQIINNCIAYDIQLLDAQYIDAYGIQPANRNVLSMARENAISKLPDYSSVLTIADGNSLWVDDDLMWVQQADSKSLSVAAASILAKVFRDRLMIDLSEQYPEYLFHQHKGYGTFVHKAAIRENGKIKNIHRLTFTKDIPNDKQII